MWRAALIIAGIVLAGCTVVGTMIVFVDNGPGSYPAQQAAQKRALAAQEQQRQAGIPPAPSKAEISAAKQQAMERADKMSSARMTHTPFMGMTGDEVLTVFGSPKTVNRSAYARDDGTVSQHEQWIYGESPNYMNVYVDDGVVTAWQKYGNS